MNKNTEEALKGDDNEALFQFIIFGRPNEKHRFDLEMTLFGLEKTIMKECKTKYCYFREVYTPSVQESLLQNAIKIANENSEEKIITFFIFINTVPNLKFLERVIENKDTITLIINREEEYSFLKEKFCTTANEDEYKNKGNILYCKITKEYFSDEAVDNFADATDSYLNRIGMTRSPYNFFKVLIEESGTKTQEL
ncbi:MAG: hypothetical protein IJ772_04965 [Bacilli bacterium]|nr:hypothetical protein [Bacilli bacterium]